MSDAVWDASALLVLLQQEPGWRELAPRLPDSAMSTVNLSEVAAKLVGSGGASDVTRDVLQGLPIETHDFTPGMAYLTAELRGPTRELGLSLGDRACLALGLRQRLPILTGDRTWLGLDLGAEIVLVRPQR